VVASVNELLKQFHAVFGPNGGDFSPGNVGVSRTAQDICHEIIKLPDPVVYEYCMAWSRRDENQREKYARRPIGIELGLVRTGQWEGAWALAQLHLDQLVKQEARTKKRLHKGGPLCNLAIVAREIGSPALTRHYAMLSSAGDIYWEHEDPELRFGGYAPTMLEQFESHHQQREWREKIRSDLKSRCTDKPRYVESFLASRWFSETYAQHFTALAEVETHGGKPFVEILLDAVDYAGTEKNTTTGARFEAASGLLLSSTPGFEVDSGRRTTDEQVDLVVIHAPDRLTQLGLEPGCGLVECKSSKGPVDVSELRDFGAKCLFHRVRFGILVARSGITGGKAKAKDLFKDLQHAELTRRRFQVDGLTLLVLDISHLRDKSRELRGLLDELRSDYRQLVFGPVP
jgi:Restriction endonuclease